jgi:hypothetical protein
MKKKSTSQSAPARRSLGEGGFFTLRVLIAALFCLVGIAVALFGAGAFAQTKQNNRSTTRQDGPGTQVPEVTQLVGPVVLNADLRDLPYIPQAPRIVGAPLKRFPPTGVPPAETSAFPHVQSLLEKIFRPMPNMPPPLLTFDGINRVQSGCNCEPPDTNGDVGPNHYVEAVNESFKVFDKNGNTLAGPTTWNSLFAPLVGTPCSGLNQGDPFAFYDQIADRWVLADFAFASFGGSPSYECIAVSQTPDPVAGGWFLYAVLDDATHANDYPKMAMWNNPLPGGAYEYTSNLWANGSTFSGVRVMALDRAAMLAGQPNPTAIRFMIPPGAGGLGDSYSLVPAGFRTGNPPPAGRDEMLLAIDSPFTENTPLTHVHGWLFHVDFVTPGNSTLGIGANHGWNADISVAPFVEAWTNAAGFSVVPQSGTTAKLDSLGDKIMTPVVYQNRNGTESLWADQTDFQTFPTGPTVVTWYQFDVTGGNFPATALQQQGWSNGNDGLWRFMPSIAVDANGNTAIGYATSSASIFPGIRYAGRLETDPPNNLGQGEATMFSGTGSQTGSRWGDYSMTTLDTDGMTFWHANEYYATTSNFNWSTRIGKFNFVGGGISPTPTPTATPTSCSWSAGPNLPSAGTRFVGVFFPANGKFYAMGGRDSNNVEFTHPFEYDPMTNMWTTKSATYPDAFTNNMGCGVLTESGIPYIYCVGGSNFTTQTTSGRTFRYNPVTDTISAVPAIWPPGDQNILPGGFSVFNNKLYTLGGFNVNVSGYDGIWEFTPPATWVQKSAHLPVPRAYIPTATIGSFIYTGGGDDATGGILTDTTDSFKYDPTADMITTIASIPRATSNTRGVNFCNQLWVLGGQFPTPSNEVDIYDPVSNTWSVGTPMIDARRNSAMDTNGTDHIWFAGGYDGSGAIVASMGIFNCPVSPCASPSPTPTATATATATATPTATTPPPSPTPTVTVPPRTTPTPRPRPTPPPRP